MDHPLASPPPKHISPLIAPLYPRHGSIKLARFQLVLVFFGLRFIDALLLFRGYPMMATSDKDLFLGFVIAMAIFTTVLLVCVWFHQNWARYIFTGTLLLIIVSGLALLPCLRDFPTLARATVDIFVLLAAYTAVTLTIISSKDIRRLTSRRFE